MYQAPPPVPRPARNQTKASRFGWAPIAAGVAAAALTSSVAWLAAPLGFAVAGVSGWWLYGKHKEELVALKETRFENLALTTFRQHGGTTMTKEQLVRDHRLHPEEADEVLNWLVTHELLTANWDNYEGPLVYERSDAAAGLPMPEPAAKPPTKRRSRFGREPVVVHHHHAPPRISGMVPEYKSPGVAMLLSFFWPGVGQMYSGNVGRGVGWMFGTWIGYAMLFVPGLIAHIMNVVNARETAEEINRYVAHYGHPPPGGHVPKQLGPPPGPPTPPPSA